MDNEEQKITNTKKCYYCKKTLDISHFTNNNKIYSKCNQCRTIINNRNIENSTQNICETCGIKARYNIPGEQLCRFCKEHKQVGMINVTEKRKCQIEGCNKRPAFNFENETKAKYCKEHAEPGMIDIISKRCQIEGCNTRPNFNFENETKAKYCKEHAEPGMIDIKNKKCQQEGCNTRPAFNFENETKAKYCKEHAEPGMIDIIHKRCQQEGCNKQSSYNFENETKSKYCKEHAELGMIDIKNKKCQQEGCNKQPSFNFENETIAKYCKEHAEPGMIDIKSKKCQKEGCNKQSSYNFENETTSKYCKEHTDPGMIDVKSKRCQKEGCKKIPSFNFENETKAKYCKEHSEPGMIDIKHKKCEKDGCNIRPTYGYCSQSPILCAKHRDLHNDKNFLYIKPKRPCIGNDDEDCKDIAEYGKTEPIHCIDHKIDDDIYLVAQKCIQCCNNDLLNKNGLCITYCAPNQLYQQVKIEKEKEKIVMNYLDKYVKLSNIINIQDDKVVDTYCNYYRPDRIYDVGTHCIIIEVDEDQHKGKRASCSKGEIGELARMHEIQNAVGMNCIFLRFNPDTFKVNNKKQSINMNERLKLLVKWIEKCEQMKPEKDLQPVKYKYLFYDGWIEIDTSFNEIDDTMLYDK
jgi:hypothetical protein